MPDVAVIGGGPAGLSAALFTAKNGLDTVVFDTDDTAMHKAYLYNYLGVPDVHGSEFMEVAREQVADHGADLREREVTGVESTLDGFRVSTEHGEVEADYLVLATGHGRELAERLDCEFDADDSVAVDRDNETTVENAYAAGWTARPDKIQAAISVGGGAAAGLDVLSKEKGEAFHDFDFPQDG